MDEQFELPVEYKGELLLLKASLQVAGYAHKFIVDVSGQEVIFEPDEERNYRAITGYGDIYENKHVDIELLKVIAKIIGQLAK